MIAQSADDTRLAVTRGGDGPALVMIDPAGAFHGLRPMAGAVPLLAERFTVYTYDRRGRGDSGDTLPFTPQREVDDLAAIIDLAGGEAFVYGFSSGAAVALSAAAGGASIPKLALMEPPFAVDEPSDEAFTAEVRRLLEQGERGAVVEFVNRSIGVPEEYVEGLRDHPAWPDLEALAHTYLYDFAVMELMTGELLSSVRQQTLIISSAGSDAYLRTAVADVAARLPHGQQREVAGGWHGVEDDELARLLIEWFL